VRGVGRPVGVEIPKQTRIRHQGHWPPPVVPHTNSIVLVNVVLHTMTELIRDPYRPRLFSFERFDIPNPRPSELLHRCPACLHPFWYYDLEGARYDALAVFVDGACTGNGTPLAKGGYGVYFGPNSPYNVSKPLKKNSPQSSQRAELMAGLVALNQIERFVKQVDDQMKRFIIITDSAYLVNSLTSYVYKWRNNDYTTSAGKEVVNRDLFERLDDKLDIMANGRPGIDVLFWKVSRSENEEADILARQGAMI